MAATETLNSYDPHQYDKLRFGGIQTHEDLSGGRELYAGDSSVVRTGGTGWLVMAEHRSV